MDRNNFGVTSSMGSISPYMNIDPAYLAIDAEPQFIMPNGADQRRGRFELAFSQIGGSVCTGGAVGGVYGLYSGLSQSKLLQVTGTAKRTTIVNSIAGWGAYSARSVGVIALLYSVFGVALSKGRGADDEINTLTSAAATGLVYNLSAGLKKSLRGGLMGLGLGAAYCLVNNREHMKKIFGM